MSVYQRQRQRRWGWGVPHTCSLARMLDLAACLPSAIQLGCRSWRLTTDSVFAPALRFPSGQNAAAAHPRRAHWQTRAQMFHPGALWRWVAHRRLSDGRLSLSLQVLEGNASRCSGHYSHTHPGRGTHTLPQQQKKEHLGDTEMLKWGQNFYCNRNQEPQPRDWFCSTSGCTLWAGGLWISVSAWCISMIWAFEKKKKSSWNKASELHETCMGWGVVIQV